MPTSPLALPRPSTTATKCPEEASVKKLVFRFAEDAAEMPEAIDFGVRRIPLRVPEFMTGVVKSESRDPDLTRSGNENKIIRFEKEMIHFLSLNIYS